MAYRGAYSPDDDCTKLGVQQIYVAATNGSGTMSLTSYVIVQDNQGACP